MTRPPSLSAVAPQNTQARTQKRAMALQGSHHRHIAHEMMRIQNRFDCVGAMAIKLQSPASEGLNLDAHVIVRNWTFFASQVTRARR